MVNIGFQDPLRDARPYRLEVSGHRQQSNSRTWPKRIIDSCMHVSARDGVPDPEQLETTLRIVHATLSLDGCEGAVVEIAQS